MPVAIVLQRRTAACISSISWEMSPSAAKIGMRRQSPRITERDESGVPSSCAAPEAEAHANDMVLLDRMLLQSGQMGIAIAQVAGDTSDEHHEQGRIQSEAR